MRAHALLAALGDNLGRAELTCELLPRLCRLIAMIRSAPICFAERTPKARRAPILNLNEFKVQKRKLGKSGLEVSALALGCMA